MNGRRYTQTSVNNFIHHKDEYLFLLRDLNKRIDGGRLNSIGGKVEIGENYLDAVIRETEEETGIKIKPQDTKLSGILKLEGGYEDDWVACFFKTEVKSKEIPNGMKTKDGTLLWIKKEDVLKSTHELVDDLYYTFPELSEGNSLFFACAKINKEEKVEAFSMTATPRK